MMSPHEGSPLVLKLDPEGCEEEEACPSKQTRGFPTMATIIVRGTILENRGSTARDHLANERTYLAWMRTGLALIGASLGLLKWSEISDLEGYLVAMVGVVSLVMATYRYFRNMRLLEGGMYEPNVHGILLVVIVVVVAIVTAFVLDWNKKRLGLLP